MTTSNSNIWQRWTPDELASADLNESENYHIKKRELQALKNDFLAEKNKFEAEKNKFFEEAKTLGFEQGKEEGYKTGFESGLTEGTKQALEESTRQQNVLVQKLTETIYNLTSELDSAAKIVPEKVMLISLSVAKHVLNHKIDDVKDLLSEKINDELEKLPLAPKSLTLKINPTDWEFINENLKNVFSQNGWKMLKDDNLNVSGFHIETDTQEIDATLESRWKEIVELTINKVKNV